MALATEFTPLPLDRLRDMAHRMKDEGYRFIQTHAVNCGDTVDLYYSFMKDGAITTYRIEGVTAEQPVPSITDIFLAAFVFENEARELFGVDMRDIVLDFQGGLYAPAESEPMRFISPEQKALIEKARKAAAAKAAKKAGAGSADAAQPAGKPWTLSDEKRAKLEEKLKDMDPEKVAKVRSALAAKEAAGQAAQANASEKAVETPKAEAAEAQPATKPETAPAQPADSDTDADLEAKLSIMEPEKAQKVRNAIAARKGLQPAEGNGADAAAEAQQVKLDSEIEAKLSLMDASKADAVRAALARHASEKGGE